MSITIQTADPDLDAQSPWVVFRLPNQHDWQVFRGGTWAFWDVVNSDTNLHKDAQFIIRAFAKAGPHFILEGAQEAGSSIDWLDAWTFIDTSVSHTKDIRDTYKNGVRDALDSFEQGHFAKLVLARTQSIDFGHFGQPSPSMGAILRNMAAQAPAAFVYACYLSESQTIWAGASPELLLRKTGNRAETVALAGTRSSAQPSPFSAKEYFEQGVVSRDLAEILAPFGKLTVSTTHPIAVSGGLTHLEANAVLELEHDTSWQTLAEALHPTPAVGGYPLGPEIEAWLAKHEPFDRQYYAGYLGPVYPNGDAELFVNIRCGRFDDQGLTLFAGAGLVKGSIPEAEWLETEAKIAAIRACFGV